MKYKFDDILLFILIIILVTTYIFIKIFSIRSEKILINYIELKSTNIINSIINKSVNNVLLNEFRNLIIENSDEDNNIKYIDFDNLNTNRIMYLINEKVLLDIVNLENANYNEINSKYINSFDKIYYIPLGVIHNNIILNLIGPKIPFKIKYLGSFNTWTSIDVKEYGINSSLVELLMNIKFQMQVLLPFKSKTITIDKSIILDSKIIQGKVPEYYGGMIAGSLK